MESNQLMRWSKRKKNRQREKREKEKESKREKKTVSTKIKQKRQNQQLGSNVKVNKRKHGKENRLEWKKTRERKHRGRTQ